MEEKKCSRMKLESILSVVSGKPTEPGMTHRLSSLDRAMGGHTLHLVFYYKSNPFLDGLMPSDLGNLRVTLSELLDEYPLMTGRLTRGPEGEWQVKFNDAGVRMLQAVVDATLDEWLGSADAAEERDLTVWEEMPDDPGFWSPFRVQISKFKCGGIALGLSCTHMLADITSATTLIKSCSLVHRRHPPSSPPIFTLPHAPPPSSLLRPPAPAPPPPPAPATAKMSSATFTFSPSALSKCLSLSPGSTSFDVLAALFFSCAALRRHGGGKHHLTICLDCRGQNQIPHNFFGNALHFSTLKVEEDELEGGLGRVSGRIHRHVAELREKGLSPGGGDVVYGGGGITCVSGEHMAEDGGGLMYEAEFEKGEKPVHVSYHVGNVGGGGVIVVMPSAEGGRAVTVILPEEEVAELCKDEVIMGFEPTMILSGRRS